MFLLSQALCTEEYKDRALNEGRMPDDLGEVAATSGEIENHKLR